MRPLTILRGEPRDGWSRLDAILATAHTLSKDLLCVECGQPKHEAWNPDAGGYYKTLSAECAGCAALDENEKSRKDEEFRREVKVWVTETDDHPHDKLRPYRIGI